MKRKKLAEPAFPKIEGHLHPDAEVLILGNASRSWYEDRGRIAELLLMLHDYGVAPTIVGDRAFVTAARYAIEDVDDVVTVLMLLTNEAPEVEAVVDAADACFVFTSRTKESIYAANMWLARYMLRGAPALGIAPDGSQLFLELAAGDAPPAP